METVADRIDLALYAGRRDPAEDAANLLLGVALDRPGAALPELAPRDFAPGDAGRLQCLLYGAMRALAAEGKPIDLSTVPARLRADGAHDAVCDLLPAGQNLLQYLNQAWQIGGGTRMEPAQLATELRALAVEREGRTAVRAAANALQGPGSPTELARVASEILAQVAAGQSAQHARFTLLDSDAIRALPPLRWLLKELLAAEGVGAMFGPSGAAKSFLGLDMVTHIAEGRDWFGYRSTGPAPVVYCALEGQAGFRKRIAAWESHNGRPIPQNLRLVIEPFKLTNTEDVDALADAVLTLGDGAVTIIDTLNGASAGLDENSSADMGLILEAAKYLQRRIGGFVLVVHHTGKDLTKGLRGHSSLRAALDTAIEVRNNNGRREWISEKVKDGEDGRVHGFALRRVVLGHDDDGDEITSCVIGPDDQPAARDNRPPPPRGTNQKMALDALGPLFKDSHQFGKAGAPPIRPCLRLDEAIEKIKGRMPVEPKRQGERARQAVASLIATRNLGHNEGWIWLT